MEIRVRGGDSFWGYSQLFGVPIQLLLDSNPGINPQALMIGQTVNIPGYVTREYQIVPGDTIWQIARTAGVPQDTLLLLNPSIQANSLRVGQIIQIPARVTNYMVHTSRPYDYGDMLEDLNTLAEVYPFIRIQSIGTSVMGKELPEIRIGIGSKQVHANASFHANEWITTPVLIRFLNEYLLALTNNGSIRGLVMNPLYESTMLSLVPMVDPDGSFIGALKGYSHLNLK